MTRWDCDVKLWRGVPCSFPAFHGWPCNRAPDVVSSSTATIRYVWCGSCLRWVPAHPRYHCCVPEPTATNPRPSADRKNSVPGGTRRADYVVSTEDNSQNHSCGVCASQMRVEFRHDIEEWVFVDCVEHEGLPIHKLCRDCVYR